MPLDTNLAMGVAAPHAATMPLNVLSNVRSEFAHGCLGTLFGRIVADLELSAAATALATAAARTTDHLLDVPRASSAAMGVLGTVRS